MTFPVSISVKANQELGPLPPIYRFFGADEPNYAYMKDGSSLLSKLGNLSSRNHQVYFRAHNLLTTGDGTPAFKWGSTNAYTEDGDGNAVYDWRIVDRILDSYLERGIRPYVEIGFMPEAMSTNPEPYQHSWTPTARYDEIYTGWTYPPKDYVKWGELVYQWAKHCVERYGREEVEKWYWETWNEPNIGYWSGTPEEFYKLHDFASEGVRRAIPRARVGGPDTAGGWETDGVTCLHGFLEHCAHGVNNATGEIGSPLDFLSFHAKGRPQYLKYHVQMGISNQLVDIDHAFGVIASFPEFKEKPIVIGECDPEGAAAAQGPELQYRNGTMYPSYTAASFARIYDLATRHGVNIEGALTWAFEFEDQSFFAGFRVLASNDIDLPVLNVFRMFARMGHTRIEASSTAQVSLEAVMEHGIQGHPDVGALASSDEGSLSVLVWHYHDDDLAGPAASITLALNGVAWNGRSEVEHFRVDDKTSNSYTLWQRIGSPQKPTSREYDEMVAAGELATISTDLVEIENGEAEVSFQLPRQGVSLLVLRRPA